MPLTHLGNDSDVYTPFSAKAGLSVMKEPEAPAKPDPDANLPVLPDTHPAHQAVLAATAALNEAIEQESTRAIRRAQIALDEALAEEKTERVHLRRAQEAQKIIDTRKRIEIDNKRKADALRAEHALREVTDPVTLRFECGVTVEIFPGRMPDQNNEERKIMTDVLFMIQREIMVAIGAARVRVKGAVPNVVPRSAEQIEAELRDVCRRGILRNYVTVSRT